MFMHITKFNQIEKKQEKCKKSCGGLIKFIVKIMKLRYPICNRKYWELIVPIISRPQNFLIIIVY